MASALMYVLSTRLDSQQAVKHISEEFVSQFIQHVRDTLEMPLFAVGEFWHGVYTLRMHKADCQMTSTPLSLILTALAPNSRASTRLFRVSAH